LAHLPDDIDKLPIRNVFTNYGIMLNQNGFNIASTQSLQQVYLSKKMQQAQSPTGPRMAGTTPSAGSKR
jgi:hypothetical protein